MHIDPGPIMRLSTAYWESQVLLTANRIGVFEAVKLGPLSVESIAEKLKTQVEPTRLFLNACVALGLLERANDGYKNSPMSQVFLVAGTPAYMGNAIRYSDNLYATWGQLEHALHSGLPPMAPETYLGRDSEKTRHFVYGMHNRALGIGRMLLDLVDLTGRTQMLDIGGGPGTYSALFVQRYPQLRSRVLDLPDVVNVAREIVSSMGVNDRIDFIPGDYGQTAYPQNNDVVLISGVFHRENPQDCQNLIARARDALAPGGLLVLSDVFTDAGGIGPTFATLFGVNMMLTASHGGVHADQDVASWLANAGFIDISTKQFAPPMPHRVVAGVKRK